MSMRGQEIRGFQSEVKQLLNLMIHSLYSNKEIFLRELISNASDAADKLRFMALSNPNLYEGNCALYVRISFDKEKRTIKINDNGIGMCREEVIDNLGTIAKSGTKAFLEKIDSNIKDSKLIGQFGVGFYSAFIVAEKVIVRTRAAGASADEGVYWESSGEGNYIIADINKQDRGTEITLHLRLEEEEFLNYLRLKSVISKYSDHIALPVEIENKSEKKINEEQVVTWEQINKAQALWTRNKVDISDDEYKEFYKHLSHDFRDPLSWSHNRVEGKQEYTSLLYVPAHAPWDMWNRDHKHGLKLYVQRVFIMDDAALMPNYLRFIIGLIDSNDLPLNVSREILQDNSVTKNMKVVLTKRVLSMLEKIADDTEKYQSFWQQFGLVLKEGPAEDPSNAENIIKIMRFATTYSDSAVQNISIEEYIGRMVEGQDKIYYITADSYAAAKSSPHLEFFRRKGIEVILLSDRVDAWMMSHITEFYGKSFQSVSKADLSLDKLTASNEEKTDEHKEDNKSIENFLKRVKDYLGDRIKEVRLTHRLTDTPAIVTTDTNDMTTQMAKLFAAAGQVAQVKYIFELNPEHKLVKRTANIIEDSLFSEWVEILLDQALLAECGTLEDPNKFIIRMNKMLMLN